MSDESGWSLTESDPAVFTSLLHSLGCSSLIVDDLWTLEDPDLLASLQPIHALIFLFKWVGRGEDGEDLPVGAQYEEDFPGFFAHQVVNNACATIAVLNGVFNIPSVPMGPDLAQLRDFSAGMDPQMSGYSITNSTPIRNAHNALSSSANSPFSIDPSLYDQDEKKKEDAYHFVVYVPVAGGLYELDGLRRAPISHGGWEGGEGWLDIARRTIQRRIESYPMGSLHFSLLAVRTDNLPGMEAELEKARAAGQEARAGELMGSIYAERAKRAQWEFENSLRRHNHVGLIHSLLLALAKAGGLDGAVEQAKRKMTERREKATKSGMDVEE